MEQPAQESSEAESEAAESDMEMEDVSPLPS
jgi:hypothetical protein